MTTLITISITLAAAFVAIATIALRSLPDSISAIVYDMPIRWQWLWTLWLWAVVLTVGIPLIDALQDSMPILGFATMASLCFVGAMPLVRHEANIPHYAIAIVAGILSQLCVLVLSPVWLLSWIVFLAVLLACEAMRITSGNKTVILMELTCAASLYGAIGAFS